MRKITKILLFVLVLSQVHCTTTILRKSHVRPSPQKVNVTHHIALFGLWEVSSPVSTKNLCQQQDWSRITTRFTATNVIVGVLTLGLYTPATVTITCEEFQSAGF